MVDVGHIVVLHFVGRIATGEERGTVFDTTDVDVALAEGIYHGHRDYKPLEFRVGRGEVITGIDETVRGMSRGESKTVRVGPDQAFGAYSEARVVEVPRDELEARSDVTAEEGELVKSETGDTGWITDVSDDVVTVDFNHELAGEPLELELRVLEVLEDDEE